MSLIQVINIFILGGENSKGKVLQVMKWKDTGVGSADGVRVKWENGSENNYRIGYKGNVDLKCLTAASGGFYYPDHLCILGELRQTSFL